MSDTQFIAYMNAFSAATDHTAGCDACRNDRPCEVGDPLHADFNAHHAARQARRHRPTSKENTVNTTETTARQTPRYTADVVCVREGAIRSVLLIERGWDPHKGLDALPGGHVDDGESPLAAAVRELAEETGVKVPASWLREVGVFDAPGRDPRGAYSTTAYVVTVPAGTQAVAGDDAVRARWVPVADLLADSEGLAFDHAQILMDALLLTGDRRA
ncbi:NUDIX domain-containing protein [Kitasatospora sp. NPDC092948]|uniref:NUDIX domain-containing protein n=1 Tax=Kitasatospora sp. NPDC092948 TaxID=3364088 RepID=UPI003821DE44